MGLFDRFRKRVTEVASEVDADELSAEENTQEARDALNTAEHREQNPRIPLPEPQTVEAPVIEEEWEDLDDIPQAVEAAPQDDEWDDFDEDEEIIINLKLLR